jgi:hypothetical protein
VSGNGHTPAASPEQSGNGSEPAAFVDHTGAPIIGPGTSQLLKAGSDDDDEEPADTA